MTKTTIGSVYCKDCKDFKGILELVITPEGLLKVELECMHRRWFKLQEI